MTKFENCWDSQREKTWVLKEAIIQKLLVFERKILRRKPNMESQNQ